MKLDAPWNSEPDPLALKSVTGTSGELKWDLRGRRKS